jgi:hypothetical protein
VLCYTFSEVSIFIYHRRTVPPHQAGAQTFSGRSIGLTLSRSLVSDGWSGKRKAPLTSKNKDC